MHTYLWVLVASVPYLVHYIQSELAWVVWEQVPGVHCKEGHLAHIHLDTGFQIGDSSLAIYLQKRNFLKIWKKKKIKTIKSFYKVLH